MSLASILTHFLAVGHNEKQNKCVLKGSKTIKPDGRITLKTKKIPNLPYEILALIFKSGIQQEAEDWENNKNSIEHKSGMRYVLGQLSYPRCVQLSDYQEYWKHTRQSVFLIEPPFMDMIRECFSHIGGDADMMMEDVMPPTETKKMKKYAKWELGLNEKFCVHIEGPREFFAKTMTELKKLYKSYTTTKWIYGGTMEMAPCEEYDYFGEWDKKTQKNWSETKDQRKEAKARGLL